MRKVAIVPANAMKALEMVGVRPSAREPVAVFAYYDHAGELRRIVARYADGWRADVRFHVDGTYSLTQSLRVRAVVTVKPVAMEAAAHG